ncbi:MAG: BatD family protein [Halioglobus sp.]
MKHRGHARGWRLLALALFCCCTLAYGDTIDDLQARGSLLIDSSLSPDRNVVPGQKVKLTLEIATDRWFTGGTRISIPEVPGLVIVQTELFATNASEIREGHTWVMQRWTLDVYPQRAGDFIIGPVLAHVQVNGGDNGDVTGELRSPSSRLNVIIPKNLEQVGQWVAAPSFTVTQSFDRNLEGLRVGDAFEQEIRFEASDVLAVMLPDYSAIQQPGLAAYPAPPVLENSNNRGQSIARSIIRISYVIEQPGHYVLPSREFPWWNTQTAQLELLALAETSVEVAGAGLPGQPAGTAGKLTPRDWLALCASLLLLILAVRLAWVHLPQPLLTASLGRWSSLKRRWRTLRKPALASRLNPGNSAGE